MLVALSFCDPHLTSNVSINTPNHNTSKSIKWTFPVPARNHLLFRNSTVTVLKTAAVCSPGDRDSSYSAQKSWQYSDTVRYSHVSLWHPYCPFPQRVSTSLLLPGTLLFSCTFPTKQRTAQIFIISAGCLLLASTIPIGPHTARKGEPGSCPQCSQGGLGMALRKSTCPHTSAFFLKHTDLSSRLSHLSSFLPKPLLVLVLLNTLCS